VIEGVPLSAHLRLGEPGGQVNALGDCAGLEGFRFDVRYFSRFQPPPPMESVRLAALVSARTDRSAGGAA
jgi:hypothetical protein